MNRLIPWLSVLFFLVSSATHMPSFASEIGFVETFALADDRDAILAQLIPGTEDYYFYTALHYQNTQRFDEVEKLLKPWIKRYQRTDRVRQIEHRQALLTYSQNSKQSLAYLQDALRLKFDHQQEKLDTKPQLPTVLADDLYAHQRLAERAFRRHKNLAGFTDRSLLWLAEADLNPIQRRHLLERLDRPDVPQLARLVVADLKHKDSRGFGSFGIHQQLLQSQLDECLDLSPDLVNSTAFVETYITKLRPTEDVNWRYDKTELAAYLGRLATFVKRLDQNFNSLKAHVFYHRLALDRTLGEPNKKRFMEYIRLPRTAPYINPRFAREPESRRYPADLGHDYSSLTLLPVIGDDSPLVANYLRHFFVSEANYKPYEPFISDAFLKRAFAEAKITAGLGDPERWYSMLSPSEYQELRDRVDLEFAPTNRQVFAPDDPVAVDLTVKNVSTLIVKVYRINTGNYYREHLQPVNSDINLDGLVPNLQEKDEYDDPPLLRVQRRFEFPELDQRGVYVVDFIGNGRSSRIVVRKGELRFLVRTGPAGQIFTVIDEDHQQVEDATLWMGGQEYAAGSDGTITVPFSTQPGRTPIVISQNGFSSLHFFEHQAETYELTAGIYVDRESLRTHTQAPALIRTGLKLNGTPVSLSLLKDVRLEVWGQDQDGVATSNQVKDFKVFENREAVHTLQVPPRLAELRLTLSAKVDSLSEAKEITLTSSETFQLNQIDATHHIEALHFLAADGQHFIELLGKSGEALPDRPIRLRLTHEDFTKEIEVDLQTDELGRCRLGSLDQITKVTATSLGGTTATRHLGPDQYRYYQTMHAQAGEPITIPWPVDIENPTRENASLLERRRGVFTVDHFSKLKLIEGQLRITGLDGGDYELRLKDLGQRILLRIATGEQNLGYVFSDRRQLEQRGTKPLQISNLSVTKDKIALQVEGVSKFARVHVFATRFVPSYSSYGRLAKVHDAEPSLRTTPVRPTLYVEGRDIGDEYRYVLDRQYTQKFPGNMLNRPSLLLNPWELRSTETGQQVAQSGEAFAASAPTEPVDAESVYPAGDTVLPATGGGDFANLDFLAESSVVLANLKPDESGTLVLDRQDLGAHQHLHFLAVDPISTSARSISLPEEEAIRVDLRLSAALDPDGHFTRQKEVTIVGAGKEIRVGDVNSSSFAYYDTLARVFTLFATLNDDVRLPEFRWLLDWPALDDATKRDKYSQFACHELSFFLHEKDPEFFDAVVAPYLKNKKDKTFLDHLLIGDDLHSYLTPWNYQQLNMVERILIGKALAAERQPMRRHVTDLFHLLPPDISRRNFLFQTAVLGQSLDASDDNVVADGLRDARQNFAGARLESMSASAPEDRALGAVARKDRRPSSEHLLKRQLYQEGEADESLGYFDDDEGRSRADYSKLYRKLDATKEWAENNYYKLFVAQQNAQLVTVNAFWNDYAQHDGDDPFFSPHVAEASRNFTEMMLALAVLDLPFTAGEHQSQLDDQGGLTLKAGSPLLLYHEQVRTAEAVEGGPDILVSQNYFAQNDRYERVDGEQREKYVTGEFVTQTLYGCRAVVTNPTAQPLKVDVLLQIPEGAVPVHKTRYTHSAHEELAPYHTRAIEYYFYFPRAGEFGHFPVHVSADGDLIAFARPTPLHVVDQPTSLDKQSWAYVSQFGSERDVVDYVSDHNVHELQLNKIAFRMKHKSYFKKIVELLSGRHAYDHVLWSYGIQHNDLPAMQEFLKHSNRFVQQCGPYLNSEPLDVDPVIRKTYQHLDYRPLVNARAHRLGRQRQIVNDRLHGQYHRLLTSLAYHPELSDDDLMSITYYLLLQDRIDEALEFFGRVQPDRLETRLQHDYFTAYLDCYRDQTGRARLIAEKYTDYPVVRWQQAFAGIGSLLDEVEGQGIRTIDDRDRTQTQTELAAQQPTFEFEIEAGKIKLRYQNLSEVTVNYYLMDLELLFSQNPFLQQHAGQFSSIEPNHTEVIELTAEGRSQEIAIPEHLGNVNVLVEITSRGKTNAQTYYSNSLDVQLTESFGQLQLASEKTSDPILAAYVKVYAQMRGGTTQFYKDGYTDLRGRFDYTSLNTDVLDQVQRFSILVISDQDGSVVMEAKPPKR